MPVSFQIQTFVSRGAGLVPGERLQAAHGPEAMKIAEALVPDVPGAVVLHVVTDDFGVARTLTQVAAYGEVPEGWLPADLTDAEEALGPASPG